MPYSPSIPPTKLEDLRRWLGAELSRINAEVGQDRVDLGFSIYYEAPNNPKTGYIYYADGSKWNPGAGEGLYERTSAGYVKLGGGNGMSVPVSHGSLQDLDADDHTQYLTDARGDIRYYTKAEIDALINPAFTQLPDTPTTYTGSAGYNVTVATDENKLVFTPAVSGVGSDRNVDGGKPSDLYLPSQIINGGVP